MTTKPDGGGHAYPTNAYQHDEHGNVIPIVGPGMTLRDRIAIAAMQSIMTWDACGVRTDSKGNRETPAQAAARIAFDYAEAMLAEREKRG